MRQVHLLDALWWSKIFANTRFKGGKLQKSESSLISVIIAEGSTNALPVFTSILAHFCIPVSLHNKNVLLRFPINDILWLVIEFFCFVVIIVWRWGVHLYYCDVERDCPEADGDEPAGDRATSHDSVHDVLVNKNVLVNKKSNAMLVFMLFSTEENLVSFLCCCFAKVLHISFQSPRMFHLYLSISWKGCKLQKSECLPFVNPRETQNSLGKDHSLLPAHLSGTICLKQSATLTVLHSKPLCF